MRGRSCLGWALPQALIWGPVGHSAGRRRGGGRAGVRLRRGAVAPSGPRAVACLPGRGGRAQPEAEAGMDESMPAPCALLGVLTPTPRTWARPFMRGAPPQALLIAPASPPAAAHTHRQP